jgi:hypothetical protein
VHTPEPEALVPATPNRWLLVNIAPDGSPAALDTWRRLRALGAHYLQPSVCLLPDRPETTCGVGRIVARVERTGGRARVFSIGMLQDADEQAVIAAFSAERSDEYDELVSRAHEFVAEIAMERDRHRATYTEVEESGVELERLRRWLASIRRRDYFDAPGYARRSPRSRHARAYWASSRPRRSRSRCTRPRRTSPWRPGAGA